MNAHEPFLRAILADPDNDMPRLVYADWLDENGDVERAEFIRRQVEVARFSPTDIRQFVATDGFDRSISFNKEIWESFVPTCVGSVIQYERGLPSRFWFRSTDDWLNRGHELTTRIPIEGISFDTGAVSSKSIKKIFRSPLLRSIRELDFLPNVSTADLRILASSEHACNIRHLSLWQRNVHDSGAFEIATAKSLSELVSLDITDNTLSAAALSAIVTSVNLPNLRELRFGQNPGTREALLSFSKCEREFESLSISNTVLGDDEIQSVCKSACLVNLKKLELINNNLSPKAVRAILTSPVFSNLEELSIYGANLHGHEFERIAESIGLNSLRRFRMVRCGLSATGAANIFESEAFANINDLDLCRNNIADYGLTAIARQGFSSNVRDMKLDRNGITGDGTDTLIRIARNRNLIRLSLNGNGIEDLVASPMAEVLALAPALKVLNLFDNRIGDKTAVTLARIAGLHTLHLARNEIGDQGASMLGQSPFIGPECFLMLHANPISRECWTAIQRERGQFVRTARDPTCHDVRPMEFPSFDQMIEFFPHILN